MHNNTHAIFWGLLTLFLLLMEFKKALKANKITQEAFASRIGMTRIGLNNKINKGNIGTSLLDSLKMMIAEKRGLTIDIKLQ